MTNENDKPDTLAGQIEEFNEAVVDLRDELLILLPGADREGVKSQSEDISLLQDTGDALIPIVAGHFGVFFGAYVGYSFGLDREGAVVVGMVLGLTVFAVAFHFIYRRSK